MLSRLKLNHLYFKDTSFVHLMTKRIFNVLLVANPYDAFMLEVYMSPSHYNLMRNISTILSAIEFDTSGEPIDFGTFMTMQEFIEKINDWEILDFLGSAYLEIDNKITENNRKRDKI